MSRSRHSEGDIAVVTAVTVEVQASLLSGVLEVEVEVELPYLSHCGQGGESESEITRVTRFLLICRSMRCAVPRAAFCFGYFKQRCCSEGQSLG